MFKNFYKIFFNLFNYFILNIKVLFGNLTYFVIMEPSIITINSIIEYFNLEKLKKILGFTFKAKFRQIDLKLIFYITIIIR